MMTKIYLSKDFKKYCFKINIIHLNFNYNRKFYLNKKTEKHILSLCNKEKITFSKFSTKMVLFSIYPGLGFGLKAIFDLFIYLLKKCF